MRNRTLTLALQTIRALATRRMRIHADGIPYDFARLPLKKILNACLVETSILFKPSRPWGWPTHLMVEPSSHCNLACTLCPVTAGLERAQGLMEFATFKKVIDEIGDYIFTLLLWDWGEPFLNPGIYDMIAYAAARGIKTISSTNAHMLAHQENADKLISSGLDTLICAVDGITQETYQHYREGGQLEFALDGIRMVVARKKALGSEKPLVNFRFIVMRHNEKEVPYLEEFVQSLGADALTLKTLNPAAQDPYAADIEAEKHDDFLPQDDRFRRFRRDSTRARIRRKRNPCKHLWCHPAVHWNGVVCTCTYDPYEKFPLGDLRKQSFREIWEGKPYHRQRRQFREDWNHLPRCSECSYAYEGGSCSHETIAEAIFFSKPKLVHV